MKLASVKNAIKKKKVSWKAGKTSRSGHTLSDLQAGSVGTRSSDEINSLSAAMSDVSTELQDRIEAFGGDAEPASAFSWLSETDNCGRPVITPPKDQSPGDTSCNSCVAFAIVGAVEARMNILKLQTAGEVNLSEGYLFFSGCGFCCTNGWTTYAGLKAAQNGIPTEEAYPYDPDTSEPPGIVQPVVYVDHFSKVMNPRDMKRAIQVKGPIVAEMTIYEDFKFYRSGIYEPVSDDEVGQHTVAVIGYNDSEEYWLCKNSWGTDWGFDPTRPDGGGFFKIRYGAAGLGTLPRYDLDLHVELSLPEAQDVIDKIAAVANQYEPLKNCLLGIAIGQPQHCLPFHAEVVEIFEDIIVAYPQLSDRLYDAIS